MVLDIHDLSFTKDDTDNCKKAELLADLLTICGARIDITIEEKIDFLCLDVQQGLFGTICKLDVKYDEKINIFGITSFVRDKVRFDLPDED